MKYALAYTFWLMSGSEDDGPTTREELEFLLSERNRVRLQFMNDAMKALKFDKCDEEMAQDTSNQNSSYSLDEKLVSLLSSKSKESS